MGFHVDEEMEKRKLVSNESEVSSSLRGALSDEAALPELIIVTLS
jgi:hypothetical protein